MYKFDFNVLIKLFSYNYNYEFVILNFYLLNNNLTKQNPSYN